MKFAVIGSGIAGLTAAWALDRRGYDVELFESRDSVAMAAHTVEFESDGQVWLGDVPSRMFNRLQWPNLCRLYEQLGVATVPVEPSQTFCQSNGPVYLRMNNGYRTEVDKKFLFQSRGRKLLKAAANLKAVGVSDLVDGVSSDLSLGAYLKDRQVSAEFVRDFLYPTLSSTVCTCSYASLDDYPASIILDVLRCLTSEGETLFKTAHGTRDVVQRLVSGSVALRLSTEVCRIAILSNAQVELTVKKAGGQVDVEAFDHVIVCTQANQAHDLLAESLTEDRDILSMFHYESVPVVVHTDSSLMPSQVKQWGTFNMVSQAGDEPAAMCSVWMNQFHSDWQLTSPVFQTINPILEPNPESVIQRVVLQRPIVNAHTQIAWGRLAEARLQQNRRLWFCGSYAATGVPLLETGVASAIEVLSALGVESPLGLADVSAVN